MKIKEDSQIRKDIFSEELSKLEEKMSVFVQSTLLEESAPDLQQKEELQRLQLRQQGNSALLTGISTEYLQSSSSVALAASAVLNTESINKSTLFESFLDSKAFLTDSFDNAQLGNSQLSAESFGTDVNYNEHFKQHLVNTSKLRFFRIENSKASKVIEEKVSDRRKMVEFKDNAIPTVRECNRGKRQLNRLSEQFMRFITVTIQRVVRGFLGRRRFLKHLRISNAFRSAVKIQSWVRGICHRKLAKVKRKL